MKQIQFYFFISCFLLNFSIKAQETKLVDTAKFKCTYQFKIIGLQQVNEPISMTIKKNYRKIDRPSFLKLKMKVGGVDLNAMDLEKVGLGSDSEKLRYDYIERDYK